MKVKNKWVQAILKSVIFNIAIFMFLAYFFPQIVEVEKPTEPLNVEFINSQETMADSGSNGGNVGNSGGALPTISAPEESKVKVSEQPTSISEAEALLETAEKEVQEHSSTSVVSINANDSQNSTASTGDKAEYGGNGINQSGSGTSNGAGTGNGTGSGDNSNSAPTGRTQDATVINKTRISYPRSLRDRGITGTVVANLDIDEGGSVVGVTIIQSSGHSAFDNAAIAGFKQWTFSPKLENGVPVATTKPVAYTFQLTD